MLNNFPMILDDSKNASQYIRDNYETLIYNLCSGKGKARSNKDLGAAKENTWSNVTICNGENPISNLQIPAELSTELLKLNVVRIFTRIQQRLTALS